MSAGRLGEEPGRRNGRLSGSLFRDTQPEWVEVDVKRVHVERSRKFGGPWLGLELLRRLDLDRFWKRRCPKGEKRFPGR